MVTAEFDRLIEDLLLVHAYDYIIFDTPPIGLVSDAMILLKTADIGLIVTRANYSKKEFLKNVDKFAKEHDLSNLGFILNGIESSKGHGYGYGYGYGDGSGRGRGSGEFDMNFSGRADADTDWSGDSYMYGAGEGRGYNYSAPYYGGYAPYGYGAPVAPQMTEEQQQALTEQQARESSPAGARPLLGGTPCGGRSQADEPLSLQLVAGQDSRSLLA